MTWDIRGKVVVVTGGNTGIGLATAEELCRRGARVTITARDGAKGAAAVEAITGRVPGAEVECRLLDLTSRASIEELAAGLLAEKPRLDVLVHNAGLILSDRREVEGGIEATFMTNHLGPFLLTELLRERLVESAPARVVVVASDAHRRMFRGLDFDDLQAARSYSGERVYSASKLANIHFARELARRLEGTGVTVNSLHPGVVATDFARDGDARGAWAFFFRWFRPFLRTPEKGARTTVHLACEPSLSGTTGAYFANCRPARPSSAARDDVAARRLWEASEALLAR
jgi:NAD(P)-dependent dehydrogenase (short-subunit alcohol dehydrogenase family)